MAHQRYAGREPSVLLLARRDKRGNDLLTSYEQMGLVLEFKRHDYICGIIIQPDSGWSVEKIGEETHVFDPAGNLRFASIVDLYQESESFATIISLTN